jgi:hypothetical protein
VRCSWHLTTLFVHPWSGDKFWSEIGNSTSVEHACDHRGKAPIAHVTAICHNVHNSSNWDPHNTEQSICKHTFCQKQYPQNVAFYISINIMLRRWSLEERSGFSHVSCETTYRRVTTNCCFLSGAKCLKTLRRQMLNGSGEITNNMQTCNRIYYSTVHWRLNMLRAAHRSSSGALTVFAVSGLHTHEVTGRSQVWVGTGASSHSDSTTAGHHMYM